MRNPRRAIFSTFLIGLIGLTMFFHNPRSDTFHTVDILLLLVCGMCFGLALSGAARLLRKQ